jgi:hypothetical protein
MIIDTKNLRELLAKATPGPWHTKTECPGRCCWHVFRNPPLYGGTPDEAGNQDEPIVMNECREDDAALMAEARNQLPAILDELEAVRTERDRLRTALKAIEQWEEPFVESRGETVSMSVAHGSNGVRDYFRGVARAALAQGQGESK